MSGDADVTIDIGKYPGKSPEDGGPTYDDGDVTISLEDSPGLTGYKRLTHKPNGGGKIGKIKKGMALKGLDDISETSVSIYYWVGDEEYKIPILIKLGNYSNGRYYTTADGETWTKRGDITSENLLWNLEYQNCKRNKHHVADINQKITTSDDSRIYDCQICGYTDINLKRDSKKFGKYNCVEYTHISSEYFGNIRNGPRTIHSSVGIVQQISVFWYHSYPKLLYYKSKEDHYWLKLQNGDKEWSREEGLARDPQTEDPSTIQKFLESYSIPKVVLDISRRKDEIYQPTGNTLYFIVRESRISETGFFKFRHTRNPSNQPFKIKGLSHNDKTLKGITSSEVLKSVSAFYSSTSPTSREKLLMVELEPHSGVSQYFERPNSSGELWTKLNREGETTATKLDEEALKEKLEKLKEEHGIKEEDNSSTTENIYTRPEYTQSEDTNHTEFGQGEDTEDIQDEYFSYTYHPPNRVHPKKPPSVPTKISPKRPNPKDTKPKSTNHPSSGQPTTVSGDSKNTEYSSSSEVGVAVGTVLGCFIGVCLLLFAVKKIGPSVRTYWTRRRSHL